MRIGVQSRARHGYAQSIGGKLGLGPRAVGERRVPCAGNRGSWWETEALSEAANGERAGRPWSGSTNSERPEGRLSPLNVSLERNECEGTDARRRTSAGMRKCPEWKMTKGGGLKSSQAEPKGRRAGKPQTRNTAEGDLLR